MEIRSAVKQILDPSWSPFTTNCLGVQLKAHNRCLIPESCNYYVFISCTLRFLIIDCMAVSVFRSNQPDKWAGKLLPQRHAGADVSGHSPEVEALGKDVSPSV